jgi:hypothetical protein
MAASSAYSVMRTCCSLPGAIVSPAERHHAPLALEALKFKFLKRQSFEILQEKGYFLPAQAIRLVAETIGQRIAPEEIKRGATAAHASSSGRWPPSFLPPCWPCAYSIVSEFY